jgi:hypothetical protein
MAAEVMPFRQQRFASGQLVYQFLNGFLIVENSLNLNSLAILQGQRSLVDALFH